MTVASPQALRFSSRVVNGLLAIKPLANFAKFQARKMMIERAESIGVPWRKRASSLMDRGLEVWEAERQAIQTPDLDYPDYYVVSFHAYESGNLSWEAATEVEVASYAAHARIWPESGAKGDGRLRQSYHTVMQEKIATAPKDILDMGCSVGLSTLALQETYPEARLTGLDLSPYFLAIANHNTPANDSLQWIHRAAEETGLPDHSYDLVSICLVCHELPRTAIRNIFAEAHRLLRPQGHLAVMDMNPNSDVHRQLPPYVLTLLKSTEPYLDDYFTFDIQQAFVETGFQPPSLTCNSPRHRTLIAQVH